MGAACSGAGGMNPDDGETVVEMPWGRVVTGSGPGVRYGVAVKPTKKNQDRWDHLSPQRNRKEILHAFGVFDGHGNCAAAAELCKVHLLQEPIKNDLDDEKTEFSMYRPFDHSEVRAGGKSPGRKRSDESVHGFVDGTVHMGKAADVDIMDLTQYDMPNIPAVPEEAPRVEVHSDDEAGEKGEMPEDSSKSTAAVGRNEDEPFPPPAPDATSKHPLLSSQKAEKGLTPSDSSIVDAFRFVDKQCAEAINTANCGSTGTSVYFAYDKKTDSWDVKCGWSGDTRAMMIKPNGKECDSLSIDHNVDSPAEMERIARCPKLPNGTPESYIARRQNKKGKFGPKAVFSGATGISHLMTRSIGDHHGAPALIPDPEIIFKQGVPSGSRIVIASDGVWDVFDEAAITKFFSGIKNPEVAARKLALEAVARRKGKGGGKKWSPDDVTAIVVDLIKP